MRTTRLGSGIDLPVVGMGTWRMGESARKRRAEVEALRLGLDLGCTLIDTAEMYGSGGAEEVVGEAIRGRRDQVFVVSKVLPSNASRRGVGEACERSLGRLGIEAIDLYLLHWPGPYPLEETLEGLAALLRAGKVRSYGLSNFDTRDLRRAVALPHGAAIASDQVLYNLRHRGVEWSLLPWCRANGVLVMAYTPLDTGALLSDPTLGRVAGRHGATPAQVALAWTVRGDGVVAVPKAASAAHVRENAAALALSLEPDDLAAIDAAFPPPAREEPLETA